MERSRIPMAHFLIKTFILVVVMTSARFSDASLPAPRLGNIWSDEMALQHGLPFNVSGFADPMSQLVPFIDNAPAGASVVCGADGVFVIEFAAQLPTSLDLNVQQGHVSL